MNRNTGESPGENRGPLLLCFVCLHHPVGAGSCPACRLFCHASGRAPVGAGVPDGPYRFSSVPPIGGIPRFRARVTFGRSPKSDQKRCLKPQVSRLPARLTAAQTYRRIPRETQITVYRRTTNRLYSSYRCRSHVPRGGTLFHGGRIRHFPAVRGSGSGDRGRSDSAWAFLRRGCDRTKGIPKTIGFWRRSFPHFFCC